VITLVGDTSVIQLIEKRFGVIETISHPGGARFAAT
jgi:hypothetical protein